ncbi:MAG: ATP-binding protein [Bryobacteraceae bacterium]
MTELETIALAANLRAVNEFVRGAGSSAGFSTGMEYRLELIVEEVFLNIARHSCPGEPVRIGCTAEPGSVALEFEYGGPYFDPRTAPEPPIGAPLSARRPGGLGVFLVRQMASEIEYAREGGRNRLRVRLTDHDTAPGGALQSSL